MPDDYKLELFKAILGVAVALLTVLATTLFGQRFSETWNLQQKKRELNLVTHQAFHALYGEFKELVKIWRLAKMVPSAIQEEERWNLLKRACALESKSEALVLRLTSEHKLNDDQLETLGLFRQAMQTIRESIRDNQECPLGSRNTEYRLLNRLAPEVLAMVAAKPEEIAAEDAKTQLSKVIAVTSARWQQVVAKRAEEEKGQPGIADSDANEDA
jgi:hypothetical protein